MDTPLYRKKRDIKQTSEPRGGEPVSHRVHDFVVQKHHASHLHYDFRLEVGGVLKSWAVPKGPPRTYTDKHLAIMVEDHPYEYRNFEGAIPKGQYGAGTVEIWDRGTYYAEDATDSADSDRRILAGLRKGVISVELKGMKLKGKYSLVRFRGQKQWLFLKSKKKS